jgi:opacity protein-like surface antigen
MKKMTHNLTARLILTGLVITVFNSSIALADTTVSKQNRYYISADYGFMDDKFQSMQNNMNWIYQGDDMGHAGATTFQSVSNKNNFFGIGAGREFVLSPKFSVRVGGEYDYLSGNYHGNLTFNSDYSPNSPGVYQFNQTSQAFFASSKLLVQPWQATALSFYVGLKAGIAINSVSNYETGANELFELNYGAHPDSTKNFAYGWSAGAEYQLFNRLGVHVGFEQVELGKLPSFTQGSWRVQTYSGTSSDINPGYLSVNTINVGLTYLF